MPVLLDSNILLRMANRDDPLHSLTREALKRLLSQGAPLCFFPQNAAEFWSVCTRPASARGGLGLSVETTNRFLSLLQRYAEPYPEIPGAFELWRDLVYSYQVMGVQVYDARLVALMKAHGLVRLLTFNVSDFVRYDFITSQSPHDLV